MCDSFRRKKKNHALNLTYKWKLDQTMLPNFFLKKTINK